MPGFSEMAIILFVVILLFGAKRLPALGKAIGESIGIFRKSLKDPKVRDVEEMK